MGTALAWGGEQDVAAKALRSVHWSARRREREALPNMVPLLQENALPRRTLLGIRPSEMDRHQTEPGP